MPAIWLGALRAFFSGIYNPWSRKQFRDLLRRECPDIVHVHNLFPFISPSILPEAKSAGIPVVMTVHNYRLVCPNGLHYVNGRICERCVGGHEYWCVFKNCAGAFGKSLGYALRNWRARVCRFFQNNISVFACLTEFQRNRLIQSGFSADQLVVVPNMVQISDKELPIQDGEYIGFSGRLSKEKGISTLVEAAKKCRDIPFSAVGGYSSTPGLIAGIPDNFKLLGFCVGEKLEIFYLRAQVIVLPSICFEGFPTVLIEAMLASKPIICSRIGGLPEIVEDGVTGLLVEPGNAEDLAEKIRYLWRRPELCRQMGAAGREKALREYSPDKYYERLMGVYKKARELCGN